MNGYMFDHNELTRVRFEKRDGLLEENIPVYPASFSPDEEFEEASTSAVCEHILLDNNSEFNSFYVRGRIRSMRKMGNLIFADLHDEVGKIQIALFKKEMDPENFSHVKKFYDIGDIVGVEGRAFLTEAGEPSIRVHRIVMLSKTIRPLPEKREGVKAIELCYRHREMDLMMNEETRNTFVTRSRIISYLRSVLDNHGAIEVETPMLQSIAGGAVAQPFQTHHNALDRDLFLRVAPEIYLKRLIVGGFEAVYEINKNFRNEGISTRHNPEFTMLEFYRAYWNCSDMMRYTEGLLSGLASFIDKESTVLSTPFNSFTVIGAIYQYTNIVLDYSDDLGDIRNKFPSVPEDIGSVDEAIMFVFETEVEGKLIAPTFITHFPKSLSPLSKSVAGDPHLADRFELYVQGMEIANAYSELNDPEEQYMNFKIQAESQGKSEECIDLDYISALERGMPPTAGLGIGIDRLVMLLTGKSSIRDVILFPTLRTIQNYSAE